MSTWTDSDGMWNVRGTFDPVLALSVSAALDRAVEALFAEAVPGTCSTDPIAKQKHLRALAFARIACGGAATGASSGRPEFVAVIDLTNDPEPMPAAASHSSVTNDGRPIGNGPDRDERRGRAGQPGPSPSVGPTVSWPIPIEVPLAVLASLVTDATVSSIVVRNGVVLHAPGRLNLGRATRLANRAQRRALRGLYSTCAIPGCAVSYDRCKLHHIEWWRHGGRTDLANLLPVCSIHHHAIHDDGWTVSLGPQRELLVQLPDGTVRTTDPPRRSAA